MLRVVLRRSLFKANLSVFRGYSVVAATAPASVAPEIKENVKPDEDEIVRILRTCQAVCFDVDSTVIPEEGIDELAAFKGVGEAVADLTKKAMGGQVLFQDALAARLDLIQPSKSDIHTYLEQREKSAAAAVVAEGSSGAESAGSGVSVNKAHRLTPGVQSLVNKLHAKGKIVYLVSGGFRQMIEPIADILNIPVHRVYANNLLFSPEDGKFAGFDANELTSRDGGKPAVVQRLIDAHGYGPVVMIGDGVTDMQAKPPAQLFIGFGGVVTREAVRTGADLFVTDFKVIEDMLDR